MVKTWRRWFDISTTDGGYHFIGITLVGALTQLSSDFWSGGSLTAYLAGLFVVAASTFWAVYLLRRTKDLDDGPATRLARRAAATIAALMFCGSVVAGL